MHKGQYSIVAARRQGYDNLLWQVPALGIAAQGFLISAALNNDAAAGLSILLLLLSSIFGLGVILLFMKLRAHEVADSELLKGYEKSQAANGYEVVHGRRIKGLSAYNFWLVILSVSALLAFAGAFFKAGQIDVPRLCAALPFSGRSEPAIAKDVTDEG